MSPKQIVPFKITSMDSLGQGVSKLTDKVIFIPKTAIGDEGEAEIISEKKGVAFARLKKMSSNSALRQEPLCPHFDKCPSCHFLHTGYDTELTVKKDSLARLLRHQSDLQIEVIPAIRRMEYRNRVQLHYDVTKKKLGMLDVHHQLIIPIPNCLIGMEAINAEVRRLYRNDHWLKEVPKNQSKGHVEIYLLNGELRLTWNRPYAEGGFTQVFQEMNEKLKDILSQWQKSTDTQTILDLFAGNGNMSQPLVFNQRLCVDIYKNKKDNPEFISQDLYDENALDRIKKELKKKNFSPDLLLIDPPRSGMKDLHLWIEEFRPKHLAYISCDAHTMARDLAKISNYSQIKTYLIDFFPSTYHFETMVFLERNN